MLFSLARGGTDRNCLAFSQCCTSERGFGDKGAAEKKGNNFCLAYRLCFRQDILVFLYISLSYVKKKSSFPFFASDNSRRLILNSNEDPATRGKQWWVQNLGMLLAALSCCALCAKQRRRNCLIRMCWSDKDASY
jgi:hypothetical protein